MAANFVIRFIHGGTHYLWPWDLVMVTSELAILPPIPVVVGMQRWFVKGLVETEK